ncbi:MAG: hypothetical protein R3251_01585 [Candidatus Spechtbacterales bacterium]|nr:hypothetical protein [Candidatus Spechtbacterales bacterium]
MPAFLSNKKIVSSLVLIFMFVIAGFFLFGGDSAPQSTRTPTGTEISFDEDGKQAAPKRDIFGELEQNSETQMAELEAVDSSDSSGIAYILTESDSTLHAVVADMPDPQAGNVYEGWLVRSDPPGFFSTGVMNKNIKEQWILKYESSGDFPAHKIVVITEEEVLDGIPERHVLEGRF